MDERVGKFFQKLVTKLDAGKPFQSSLRELAASDEVAPALQPVAEQLADDIGTGSSFAQALAKHPTVFEPGYVAILKVFEDQK
ncbi:MAG: type II secretion system F family protein [Planctomycetota bacterium]|jgi:type II secretory pathway component PulF|nr:type II secretion system F family protein [Planctomycetota bacterium]MDP7130509.1 type II secretion system F family protein [Planctomycetota bacterium]MDP7254013.1 type II secretion system F family protein [Planctomycetota bacterium]